MRRGVFCMQFGRDFPYKRQGRLLQACRSAPTWSNWRANLRNTGNFRRSINNLWHLDVPRGANTSRRRAKPMTTQKSRKSTSTSRRKFLRAAAAAAAATAVAPRSSRRRDRFPALAEHMAVEGYLPRIRARLRQDGQRHDRR